MKVVIIGSGNVATVLGKKILAAGHKILQVVSRSPEHAQLLAAQLQSAASTSLKTIDTNADIYLISVGDNSIEAVAKTLPILNGTIAHTAGGVSKNILQSAHSFGVVYPLQSLRKEMEQLPEIPVLIDGKSKEVSKLLFDFALTWSSAVTYATEEERLKLHVAAVFASNFTNHLYALAEDFCKKEGVAFEILLPLIKETTARLSQSSPANLQTGPASRNDIVTINKHLEVLAAYPQLLELYKVLSESIMHSKFS